MQASALAFSETTLLLAHRTLHAPECEAKVMFGRHIFQDAAAAGRLAERVRALGDDVRLGSRERSAWSEAGLQARAIAGTAEWLAFAYLRIKWSLRDAIDRHRAATVVPTDEPTVVLLDELSAMLGRQIDESRTLFDQLRATFAAHFPMTIDDELRRCGTSTCAASAGELLPLPERPARDPRVKMTGKPPDMADTLGLLHLNLTDTEFATIEACSRFILEGPEMPWEFVMDLGRQCWDESRHALGFWQRLEALGGQLGQYAATHKLWDMCTGQPLQVRLAVHQRIGEWIGVDGALYLSERFRRSGDTQTGDLFEYVARDEISHVALGNKWIRYITKTPDVLARTHQAALARRSAFGSAFEGPLTFPLNVAACVEAGFETATVEEFERRYKTFGSRIR